MISLLPQNNEPTGNTAPPVKSITSQDKTHLNIDNWTRPFFRSVFSSENGTGSTARLGTMSVIWTTMAITAFLVIRDNKIPDNIMNLGYFSALMVLTVYSPSKITGILKTYFTKK